MAKGGKTTAQQVLEKTKELVAEYAKPAIHYGFIPAVILVGLLATKPRPSVWQLLAPFG